MAWHVPVRLGVSPHIKAGQGNPEGEKEVPKSGKKKKSDSLISAVSHNTRTSIHPSTKYMTGSGQT